jgi:hypothetical protein
VPASRIGDDQLPDAVSAGRSALTAAIGRWCPYQALAKAIAPGLPDVDQAL